MRWVAAALLLSCAPQGPTTRAANPLRELTVCVLSEGVPVHGAGVVVIADSPRFRATVLDTDEGGQVTLRLNPTIQRIRLLVSHQAQGRTNATFRDVDVLATSGPLRVDLSSEPREGSLRGTVRDAAGRALGGASVWLTTTRPVHPVDDPLFRTLVAREGVETRTGQDGRFHVEGLRRDQSYRVTAFKGDHRLMAPLVTKEGVDLDVVLSLERGSRAERPSRVSGKVTSPLALPASGAQVCRLEGSCVQTNLFGEFVIDELPRGEVTLKAALEDRASATWQGQAPAEGVEIRLRRAGDLRVEVIDRDGAPRSGLSVFVVCDDGAGKVVFTSDDRGRFDIRGRGGVCRLRPIQIAGWEDVEAFDPVRVEVPAKGRREVTIAARPRRGSQLRVVFPGASHWSEAKLVSEREGPEASELTSTDLDDKPFVSLKKDVAIFIDVPPGNYELVVRDSFNDSWLKKTIPVDLTKPGIHVVYVEFGPEDLVAD